MNLFHKKHNKIKFVIFLFGILQLFSNLSGCTKNQPEYITPAYQAIIDTKPEFTLDEGRPPEHPPEHIAETLVNFLDKTSSNNNIRGCAAIDRDMELGEESVCYYEEMIEVNTECLVKAGYWKDRLHTHLFSRQTDLNGDNLPDYVVTGDNCSYLAGNAASDFFVLLSQQDNSYTVALSTSTTYFSVLPTLKNQGKLIVEGTASNRGIAANIWHLAGNQYVREACFYKLHNEHEPPYEKFECTEHDK